jgi:hypothetical protein
MNPSPLPLPECYLADLPSEAEVTTDLIREAWLALQRNREQHLEGMTTQAVTHGLETAAALWLEPDSSYMRRAMATGPDQLGFSGETLEAGLRQMFASITVSELETWIEQDLGHPNRLDEFCASGPERGSGRRSKAIGPAALAHFTAGNIPASPVASMVAGLLIRSAQFVKCAKGSSLIPRLFAHSIREVSPHLGACIEIAEWPRQREDLNQALIEPAECVTATGTNETVTALRSATPITKRFVGYGHKLSFAYLAADALTRDQIESLATTAARDVCAWDQLGCLSPHVIYAEEGGGASAEFFAGQLAAALAQHEERAPRGNLSPEDAAAIRSRRSFYEVRAAHSSETKLWQSDDSTAWTVVYEADAQFQASCLNRFVYVKGVDRLESALRGADPVRHLVSTVGVAGSSSRVAELAARLGEWGVARICPVGGMQAPPLTWRHDGRPVLNDLVRWSDWETS